MSSKKNSKDELLNEAVKYILHGLAQSECTNKEELIILSLVNLDEFTNHPMFLKRKLSIVNEKSTNKPLKIIPETEYTLENGWFLSEFFDLDNINKIIPNKSHRIKYLDSLFEKGYLNRAFVRTYHKKNGVSSSIRKIYSLNALSYMLLGNAYYYVYLYDNRKTGKYMSFIKFYEKEFVGIYTKRDKHYIELINYEIIRKLFGG